MAAEILAADRPKVAKAVGRRVTGFKDKLWTDNCREIVTRGNVEKFKQNQPLRELLCSTAGKVLVEASRTTGSGGLGCGRVTRARWTQSSGRVAIC